MQTVYTIAETALMMKVSSDTIERLIKNGKLSATKFGAQWRISEDQLNEYIQSRTLKARKIKAAI